MPADETLLAVIGTALDGRPVWLASSTHAGEEALAGRVHRALATLHPGLLTMIAPRHPDRGGEVAAELQALGLTVARHSRRELPHATDIFLADTMGELGLFYRLAPIVFMGKPLQGLSFKQMRPFRYDMQIVFQDPYGSLSPRMSVADIIAEGLKVHQPQLDSAARDARNEPARTNWARSG